MSEECLNVQPGTATEHKLWKLPKQCPNVTSWNSVLGVLLYCCVNVDASSSTYSYNSERVRSWGHLRCRRNTQCVFVWIEVIALTRRPFSVNKWMGTMRQGDQSHWSVCELKGKHESHGQRREMKPRKDLFFRALTAGFPLQAVDRVFFFNMRDGGPSIA